MRRSAKIILVAVALVSLYLATRRSGAPAVPAVIVMERNYKIPPQKVSLFARTVPATKSWGWLWKLKEAITGRRKTIYIEAAVLDMSNWDESRTANGSLPKSDFKGANGVEIWILDGAKLSALQDGLKQKEQAETLMVPRITTVEDGEARLSSITTASINNVPVTYGFSMDALPRLRRDVIDLTMLLNYSDLVPNLPANDGSQTLATLIQTNLAVAMRIQIPGNSGVFLLDARRGEPGRKRIGVILSTKIITPKK